MKLSSKSVHNSSVFFNTLDCREVGFRNLQMVFSPSSPLEYTDHILKTSVALRVGKDSTISMSNNFLPTYAYVSLNFILLRFIAPLVPI